METNKKRVELLHQILPVREITGKQKLLALENVEYITYTIPAENLLKQSFNGNTR